MKVLLIDDKANLGWKQILEKVFPIQGMVIEVATDYTSAIEKIKGKYDLIFLDVRLNAVDHEKFKVEDFSGYKILKDIKNEFLSVNFATPMILMTATNKIWNIDAFRNYGVDTYYIKEHPNYVFDKETSKKNYENLKNNFDRLRLEGIKRNEIWNLSKNIIELISSHYYFKENNKYENVKNRIIDKLKLGFVYLFKEQSLLEKELLKTNNESLAFIIYWSIIEEIVKGFTEYSTWNPPIWEFTGNWEFRNTEYFIESLNNDKFKVNISKDLNNHYQKQEVEYNIRNSEYDKYAKGFINLSEQVYALLAAYVNDNTAFNTKSREFSEINTFRNKVDFIHSDLKNIYERELIIEADLEENYNYSAKVLKFINDLLKLLP